MGEKDYYNILGLTRETATSKDIKAARKDFVFRFHPDRNPDDDVAAAKYKLVNEAYGVLSDPVKRHRYDQNDPRNLQTKINKAYKEITDLFDKCDNVSPEKIATIEGILDEITLLPAEEIKSPQPDTYVMVTREDALRMQLSDKRSEQAETYKTMLETFVRAIYKKIGQEIIGLDEKDNVAVLTMLGLSARTFEEKVRDFQYFLNAVKRVAEKYGVHEDVKQKGLEGILDKICAKADTEIRNIGQPPWRSALFITKKPKPLSEQVDEVLGYLDLADKVAKEYHVDNDRLNNSIKQLMDALYGKTRETITAYLPQQYGPDTKPEIRQIKYLLDLTIKTEDRYGVKSDFLRDLYGDLNRRVEPLISNPFCNDVVREYKKVQAEVKYVADKHMRSLT